MKERGGWVRLWKMVLVLALVVGPGLAPAGAAGIYQGDHAGLAEGEVPGDGVADPSSDLSSAGLPPGIDAGWWATVQEDMRQSEYEVTWQERTYLADLAAAYQAPNRAHNLRTYFAPEGLRVIPRTFEGETPPWEWGLALRGYGYASTALSTGADGVQPVGAATLYSEGNRIEYRRDELTEWYVNDEQGLEQGFTLHAPPQPGGEGDLVLELALHGDLSPQLTADGTAVEFITSGGVRVLHYGGLAVEDATGRNLLARLELGQDTIRILFDVSGALYPITVDPLATSPSWTAESDQYGSYFGFSLGTAGDVNGDGYSDVIVGAPFYDNGEEEEGRAYVYHGSATGLSAAPAWTAESNQEMAWFGRSVGMAGDVNGDGFGDVIVGAPNYDGDQMWEGRAYVYLGGSAGLGIFPAWTADGNQYNASLGEEVATAGDVNGDGYSDVIVGAYTYDNGQMDEGRAFVYHGSAVGLSSTPAWTAEGNQTSAWFGRSARTAGDVNCDGYSDVIVGAYGYDGDYTGAGRAYVYHGSATGLGTTPAWVAEGKQEMAGFGTSVGTAGDVNGDGFSDVIVGAPGDDNDQKDEGRAFVFLGSGAGLSGSPAWTAEGDQIDAGCGYRVGTAGDVNGDGFSDVIVGVPGYYNVELFEGRADVYHGGATGLGTNPIWTAEGNVPYAHFGWPVGTAGDVNGDGYSDIIVGAYEYDNDQPNEGRAFVYHGGAAGLGSFHGWVAESNEDHAELGKSVGTAGDVNGDGFSDIVVGAPSYDGGQLSEGRAFVYLGGTAGVGASPAWSAESDQAFSRFGSSTGTAGDVNGDGYSDLIVSAPWYDGGETDEGRAYVYHGGATGPEDTPRWTAESDQDGAAFGRSVGTAGDVNGDGYSDVIVGAPQYDNSYADEGAAFVYLGGPGGLDESFAWTAEGKQSNAYFGIAVGTAGDVNGDGYSDAIIGASLWDGGQTDEGRACVYLGSATGLGSNADWTAEGNQAGAGFGTSAGTAGDVNGDGYSDIIVGAPWYSGGQTDEGRAYVYHGNSVTGLGGTPAWTAESNQTSAYFAYSAGTAGDVNGDGYSDVVIGAYLYDNGQMSEGRAYAYHGGPAGLSTTSAWSAESNQEGARFGYAAGTAGDVNGDGYSDVIVGAYCYENDQPDEGRIYVYYGNGGDGLHLRPRQVDGSGIIAHLGMSDDPTSFSLALIARMPLGRQEVKLQWQVAPLGVRFGDSSVIEGTSPAWVDAIAGMIPIGQTITGLAPDTAYHWRVRLLYRPGNALGQPASRWIHIPWAGWNETDLRTARRWYAYLPLVARNH